MIRAGDVATLRDVTSTRRAAGARIGFVPTMGALHEAHLSLVDHARAASDLVVVSVFVNPLQFAPGEDFERYPRDLDADAALLAGRGVDVLFAPALDALYPQGEPVVRVVPGPPGERLCGEFRPGHFEGVLTVVAKLFNLVDPDVAVFGAKDFQQSVLIRRMVADLDFRTEVLVAPIVREPDGLALSSRNAYLAAADRRRAPALSRALGAARDAYRGGEQEAAKLRTIARGVLADAGLDPQYLELVDPDTLESLSRARPGAVLALAAYVGETRLIDNIVL
ncbi:MAG: pantoate--beta-alanine ligase [Longimicrobiales bacterium]